MGLGCIAAGAKQVTPDIMLAAAKAAATKLTPEELEQDSILPQVDRIRCLPTVHLQMSYGLICIGVCVRPTLQVAA